MKRISLLLYVLSLYLLIFAPTATAWGTERRGRECMDYMAYGEAIRHFEEILSKDPEKRGIRVDLAFSLFRNGESDKAIKVLERELTLHPDTIDAHALLGYILYSYDKKEEALLVCQKFDTQYIEIISRNISLKWGAPLKSIYEEVFWSRRRPKDSPRPLDILIAKVYAREKFYAPDKEEEEESFNKILEKLRKQHPNLGLPHFLLGFLQKKSGEIVESEKNFKLALLNGYDRRECYSQLVDLKFLQEDWTGGLQLAKNTLEILGPLSKMFFLMGYASNQLQDEETAKLYFEETIEHAPYCVEARKNLARIQLCQSKFEESTKAFKQVVRLAPLDLDSRLLRNRSLSRNPGLKKDGRPFLTKDLVDQVGLNYTYVFHSNLQKALVTINERAFSMLRSGHLDQAVASLSAFLELYDINPVLHYNLGLLYLDQNNLKEALRFVWKAAELDPEYLEPLDLAANVLHRIGDFERSLSVYHEVLRIDPDDAQAYYNIGLTHWSMGNHEEAEQFWHSAIQKDRKAKKAKLNKGSESKELVHSLTVKTRPVSFDAHKSLGGLYDELGKKELALQEYKAALEFVPNDSECYYYLGKIYYEMGDRKRAMTNLEKCLYWGKKWEKKANDILNKMKRDSDENRIEVRFEHLRREAR